MKTKLLVFSLFALTAVAVILVPLGHGTGSTRQIVHQEIQARLQRPQIEVVFVLDTTGSMSGLIEAAKEKIWSIASSMAQADPAPEIRMGLVAYRDRGDVYVTKLVDLASDLDSVYASLMDFRAQGGGDGPESVNRALLDAVDRISWSQDADTYRVLFLVGDAPPHSDYQDEPQYPQILARAKAKQIVVNTIQAGNARTTAREWRQIAALGAGRYFQVEQSGNAVAIATPFDEKLAKLSKALDDTKLYYGDEETRAEKAKKMDATRKLHASASLESRARRATFNSSASGKSNLLGGNELVDDIASGRVKLEDLDSSLLPEPLQALSPTVQQRMIDEASGKRQKLQAEIEQLATERREYLEKEVAAKGGGEASLDVKLFDAVKAQAATKGIEYRSAAPAY